MPLLLCCLLLTALTCFGRAGAHFMPGMGEDPYRVPTWEEVFATGPFAAPRESSSGPLQLPHVGNPSAHSWVLRGWTAIYRLDDREAQRCFRQALELEKEVPMALFGLALANAEKPGRAALFIRRCDLVKTALPSVEQAQITAYVHYYSEVGLLSKEVGKPTVPPAEQLRHRARDLLIKLAQVAMENPNHHEAAAILLLERLRQQVGGLAIEASPGSLEKSLAELERTVPGHPVGHCRWLLAKSTSPEEALRLIHRLPPESAREKMAASFMLERQGHLSEAASWLKAAAGQLAGELEASWFDPATMEEFHAVLERLVFVLASAAQVEEARQVAAEAGSEVLAGTLLRLEQWEGLLAECPVRVANSLSMAEKASWWHGAAVAALRTGKKEIFLAHLANLRESPVRARQDAPTPTPETLDHLAQLTRHAEATMYLADGRKAEALGLLPALSRVSPALRARLALQAGDLASAVKLADEAWLKAPWGLPEIRLRAEIASAGGPDAEVSTLLASPELGRLLASAPPQWPGAAELGAPRTKMGNAISDHQPLGSSLLPGDDSTDFRWTPPVAPRAELPPWPEAAPRLVGQKATVYLFFLGAGCNHCLRQLNEFARFHAAFRTAGVELIAVSTDGPEGVANTKRDAKGKEAPKHFPFPILPDPENRAFRMWQAYDFIAQKAVHGTFLADSSGKLRWLTTGKEPFMYPEVVLSMARNL